MSIWSMPTPKKYEALPPQMVAMLLRSFPGVQGTILGIADIDHKRGAGVLEDGTKCVWTKDGKRITFWTGHGDGYGASASKETDPLADPAARAAA